MNYLNQVFPKIKSGDKFARTSWGRKAKYIQLNLKGHDVKAFDDPNVDIYPFIAIHLTDNHLGELGMEHGQCPAWNPQTEDQQANDWYVVNS